MFKCVEPSFAFLVMSNFFLLMKLQVIDYYSKKGIVASLPADKPPKEVTIEVEKVLSS